jgi:heat shock protein HtpX
MLVSPTLMGLDASCLPSRKWSIVAWGSVGIAAVVVSYLLAIAVALGCLALPLIFFVVIPIDRGNLLFIRLLLSLFGIVAGSTIVWSLLPRQNKVQIQGVPIDLSKEIRLTRLIQEIAAALKEPMPSEVYLIGDANAFVVEAGGRISGGKRRIMALGLPLLQMLTISQFRAVLAHEFAHYYAGDTRLGPLVYSTRRAMARAYENLGKKSDVLSFLTRYIVVAGPYILLMGAMRMYWKAFMRLTQFISRNQEYRSDELACYIAGSQPLIEGLQNIHRCQAALGWYWNAFVLPVAGGGYHPPIADGFLRFMNAPHIAKATTDSLTKQMEETETNPFDTHPPMNKRIERAQLINRPTTVTGDQENGSNPMISLIDDLAPLETSLLKKAVPNLANSQLKSMNWENAGIDVYVPSWRRQIANFLPLLSPKTLSALPAIVADLKPISDTVMNPPGILLNRTQRDAKALEVLSCALAVTLLDHGWKLDMQPGIFNLTNDDRKIDPTAVIPAMRSGKLSAQQWEMLCTESGIGDWPLATPN